MFYRPFSFSDRSAFGTRLALFSGLLSAPRGGFRVLHPYQRVILIGKIPTRSRNFTDVAYLQRERYAGRVLELMPRCVASSAFVGRFPARIVPKEVGCLLESIAPYEDLRPFPK